MRLTDPLLCGYCAQVAWGQRSYRLVWNRTQPVQNWPAKPIATTARSVINLWLAPITWWSIQFPKWCFVCLSLTSAAVFAFFWALQIAFGRVMSCRTDARHVFWRQRLLDPSVPAWFSCWIGLSIGCATGYAALSVNGLVSTNSSWINLFNSAGTDNRLLHVCLVCDVAIGTNCRIYCQDYAGIKISAGWWLLVSATARALWHCF